jgi:hypothetical protein
VWKMLHYFILCIFPLFFVHYFPAIFFCSHKQLFDILVLADRIGSTSSGRSAHLFGINVCFIVIFEWVLIWLLNCQDRIKVIKLIPLPLFPHLKQSFLLVYFNRRLLFAYFGGWNLIRGFVSQLPILNVALGCRVCLRLALMNIFFPKKITLTGSSGTVSRIAP